MTQTNASLIRMVKSVGSKIDLAKNIIRLMICFDDTKLSDTEITVLAYFMVYGVKPTTKDLIVRAEVCKNLGNIKTIMVKLKKLELIYKDDLNGKVYVSKSFPQELTPVIGLYFKLQS